MLASLFAAVAKDVRALGRSAVAASLAAAAGFGTVAGLVFARGPLWVGDGWMVDRFSALMIVLIQIVWTAAAVVSTRYVGREHDAGVLSTRKVRIYYGLLPLFVLSMFVTVTTDHLGVLWIALEATTLTTTPLVALYKKDGAIEAAWKYLLLCSLGISVSLLGLLLLAYAGVGAGLPLDRAFSLAALRGGPPRSTRRWCAGPSCSCSSASAPRSASCRCTRGCPTPTAGPRLPCRPACRACC